MTAILDTPRLRLREFRPDDLDELARMVADEEQMRFYPGPRTRDEARAWIGRNLSLYEEHGFGFWLLESRGTSEFLGYCGIRPLVLEGASVTEIGWHTKKTSWNRGIATEAATAVRDVAFARFAQTRLVALVHPDHLASRRVAEKIGMGEEAAVVIEGDLYVTYVRASPAPVRSRPMADALEQLKSRLTDVRSLYALKWLLDWDERTMMPPAGSGHRADHQALLSRLLHERIVDPEVERWLDELAPLEASLDPDSDDAALIRVARRERDKRVRVPEELASEMARAAAESTPVWLEAKATSDFDLFLPVLERQVELRRRYIECFEPDGEPYDVLLDDFEPEMKTAEVSRIFAEIKEELVPLIAELREREVDDTLLTGHFPIEKQVQLSNDIVDLFGHRPDTWRIDPTVHPFASGAGIDDVRITTYYFEHNLQSLFATMHEYGHGLYEHQIPRRIAHLPTGMYASLAVHESQSRLWENLVGRSLPFWRFYYPRLQELFPEKFGNVELERFYAAVNAVRPGLIRIEADEVTYGMHVILRFELEQDIVNGRVELRDVPRRWAEKMEEYLGVQVPDHAHGVLQDMHWAAGNIGYFSTYLLGSVMSVQLWEKAVEAVPDLEDQIERGEFGALRGWLEENVHAHGRKYPPQEILRRAVGTTIDAKPYLAYLKRKYGAPVAA